MLVDQLPSQSIKIAVEDRNWHSASGKAELCRHRRPIFVDICPQEDVVMQYGHGVVWQHHYEDDHLMNSMLVMEDPSDGTSRFGASRRWCGYQVVVQLGATVHFAWTLILFVMQPPTRLF